LMNCAPTIAACARLASPSRAAAAAIAADPDPPGLVARSE
jgi:hypothetical protein